MRSQIFFGKTRWKTDKKTCKLELYTIRDNWAILGQRWPILTPFFGHFLKKIEVFFLINILFYTYIFTLNHCKRYKSSFRDQINEITDLDLAPPLPLMRLHLVSESIILCSSVGGIWCPSAFNFVSFAQIFNSSLWKVMKFVANPYKISDILSFTICMSARHC